jgi:pimeloyl-ACP methyl ester carboxylesterase
MNESVNLFKISVPDADIEDLHHRLRMTRWPDQIPGSEWAYGVKTEYMRELCEYWARDYDWRHWETEINRFPQYTTEIDDHLIHFIHARSSHKNATPILISHGWPGSIVEFLKIIEPLTEPTQFGGKAEDAFHVISPSLPGYGFSGATQREGIGALAIAEMFAELMARLGYSNYIAQGGDWGAAITSSIGVVDADNLLGIHLNMPFGFPADDADRENLSEVEQADLADMAHFEEQESRARNHRRLVLGLTIRQQVFVHGLRKSSEPGWIVMAILNLSYLETSCSRISLSIGSLRVFARQHVSIMKSYKTKASIFWKLPLRYQQVLRDFQRK